MAKSRIKEYFLTVQIYLFFLFVCLLTFLDDECSRSRGRLITSAEHFTTCRYQST